MTESLFATIIAIFSGITLFFLFIFVFWWLVSRWADYSRGRRILISQRDIKSSYNIIKKDTQRALDILSVGVVDDSKISEAKYLLNRVNENLEKMDKYAAKGVDVIGKYDLIKKINKEIKI